MQRSSVARASPAPRVDAESVTEQVGCDYRENDRARRYEQESRFDEHVLPTLSQHIPPSGDAKWRADTKE
jgi:hypothetical protein